MEINVKGSLKANKYIYEITSSDFNLSGEATYTFGVLPRKICVRTDQDECVLKQTNWFLKAVNFLVPFLWLRNFPVFHLYRNGAECGKTRTLVFTPIEQLNYNNDCYELCLHANNRISIMKNDTQIALGCKKHVTYTEKSTYVFECDETAAQDAVLLGTLIIYADLMYFPRRFTWNAIKYERTVDLTPDKRKDRTEWHPKANRDIIGGDESENEG